MTTTVCTTAYAKEDFTDLIHRVTQNKEHVILTRRDKEIAVVIPWEDWLILRDLLNKNDLEESLQALKEARAEGTITLEQLKEKLG